MKYFLFFLTFSFIFIYGCDRPSKNVLFSDFPEGASKEYSVIGVSAFYDKEMINKNYTFYINDDIGLKSLKDSLIAGSEAYTMGPDDKMFHVFLVKGKEMLNPSIHINPNNENIIFNGRYFDFDPGQLLRLNKKYPVNYSLESIEFSTQTECEHFLSEHQNDDRLLCYKNITSVYNGEATVYISSDEVMTWKGGIDLIKSITDPITTDDRECSISYVPTENEKERFKYSIHSSEVIYEQILHGKIDKQKWIQNKKEIFVYWNNDIKSITT